MDKVPNARKQSQRRQEILAALDGLLGDWDAKYATNGVGEDGQAAYADMQNALVSARGWIDGMRFAKTDARVTEYVQRVRDLLSEICHIGRRSGGQAVLCRKIDDFSAAVRAWAQLN